MHQTTQLFRLTAAFIALLIPLLLGCVGGATITKRQSPSTAHHAAATANVPRISPDPRGLRAARLALAQVGRAYVWGATGPNAFDCSGLVQWVYAQQGVGIPRTTYTQFPALSPIRASQIRPGDLIFFAIERPNAISHVGMYVGDVDGDGQGDMVHASTPELGVIIESNVFGRSFWQQHFAGVRRVLPNDQ